VVGIVPVRPATTGAAVVVEGAGDADGRAAVAADIVVTVDTEDTEDAEGATGDVALPAADTVIA